MNTIENEDRDFSLVDNNDKTKKLYFGTSKAIIDPVKLMAKLDRLIDSLKKKETEKVRL